VDVRVYRLFTTMIAAAACVSTAGCKLDINKDDDDDRSRHETPAQAPAPAPAPAAAVDTANQLRFLVDKSDRMLYVIRAQDTLRRDPVAIGMPDHPTPTGSWEINRVDWNPDWTPPPGEDWTEDKDPQPPGSPKNPMGRARLVFSPPYTIHGTREKQSLGKAASHGSIRVANETVLQLARLVMDEGGAPRPESFYMDVDANRSRMQQVDLPKPVPITVQE
jgi:lipoprotein-anchoring transpeptidase ErfK/SrfK